MSILSSYDRDRIQEFEKDIRFVVSVNKNIDLEYAGAKREFIHDFVIFKRLLKEWNKKYRKLHLGHSEDGMEIKLNIIIKGQTPQDVIIVAARIQDLSTADSEVSQILKNPDRSIDLVYRNEEGDENTLTLEPISDSEMKLIYLGSDLISPGKPEFEISAFFALKDYDPKIDILGFEQHFSFNTGYEESEGKGISYQDRVRFFDKV